MFALQKETVQMWWRAARPPFYIATLIPVFLALSFACSQGWQVRPLVLAGTLLECLLLHLAANLGNDYFDYTQGVDTEKTIGGSGILTSGRITVGQLKRVLCILYGLIALLLVLGMWYTARPGLLLIVLFAAFSSYFYVAPPVRYGYRAWGELFVFFNMGPIMTAGVYYVFTGVWSGPVLAMSVPVGLMVAGILFYQSLPEIETDKAAGKMTLANRLGPVRAVFLFQLWWPAVWAFIVTLWLAGTFVWPVLFGVLLSIPLHVKTCRLVAQNHGTWVALDAYGKYVRLMYLVCGVFMIIGVAAC